MKHPMQPIEIDAHGRARFRGNKIVEYILDHAAEVVHPGAPNIDPDTGQPYHKGCLDLTKLAMLKFPQEDREQFAQLMGYSVAGYNELSYVSDASAREANEKAKALRVGAGCRDTDCPIHTRDAK